MWICWRMRTYTISWLSFGYHWLWLDMDWSGFFLCPKESSQKNHLGHPNSIVVGDKNPTKKSDDLPIVSPSNIPPYLPIDFHHLCHGQQLDSTFTPGKIGDAHLTMFKGIYFIYSTCTYTYTYTYIYIYIYIHIMIIYIPMGYIYIAMMIWFPLWDDHTTSIPWAPFKPPILGD